MRTKKTLERPVVKKPEGRTYTLGRLLYFRRGGTDDGRSIGIPISRQSPAEGTRVGPEPGNSDTSPGHRVLEVVGITSFALLAVLIGAEVYRGMESFGYLWLLPLLGVVAYLAADLLSGFVHFLLDNFGSTRTPVFGPYFIKPFRDHHTDPLGIIRHDFVDTNGNNSLASVPMMLAVWLAVPVGTTIVGYLFGTFFLLLCLAVFVTNQFHKWAHMDAPPSWVRWLQRHGMILSKEHHDVHHESPYDTYYCITVGVWNPLFDRTNFFEQTERLIRRLVPGTNPQLRSEREGSLNVSTPDETEGP